MSVWTLALPYGWASAWVCRSALRTACELVYALAWTLASPYEWASAWVCRSVLRMACE